MEESGISFNQLHYVETFNLKYKYIYDACYSRNPPCSHRQTIG